MIKVPMPRLSEAMTEGKLLAWNVAVGDYVAKGDLIAEIEADKANMEIEAPADGRVVALMATPGEAVPINQPLAEIDESDVSGVSASPVPAASDAATAENRSPLAERLKKFNTR